MKKNCEDPDIKIIEMKKNCEDPDNGHLRFRTVGVHNIRGLTPSINTSHFQTKKHIFRYFGQSGNLAIWLYSQWVQNP